MCSPFALVCGSAILFFFFFSQYYHNINGSQVTGESPFEIWLNEAVRGT